MAKEWNGIKFFMKYFFYWWFVKVEFVEGEYHQVYENLWSFQYNN